MLRTHRSSRMTAVTLAFLATAASACGSSESSTSPPASTAEAAAATSPTSSAAPASDELVAAREVASRPQQSFVGKVEDTDTYVAVVDDGVEITAYFCDSDKLGLWFTAPTADSITGSNPAGATLQADFADGSVTGQITIDGAAHAFSAAPAEYPAGLWEGFVNPSVAPDVIDGHSGWIVLPDGSQRGSKVKNTSTSSAGTLDTGTGTGSDGTAATPSAPPPPQPTGETTAEFCDRWAGIMNNINSKLRDPLFGVLDDSRKMYERALSAAIRNYDSKNCTKVLGG